MSSVSPSRIRRFLRAAHRKFVFRRAFRRFLTDPEACSRPGEPVLTDLVYGWGNQSWSALDEYLAGCVHHALTTRGPILECGSGLSTVLIGAIATKRGLEHWALENTPEWAAKVQRALDTYKLASVVSCTSPLKDHGAYCWYDAPLESLPESFSLVICDGPVGSTKGGRYGLSPIMRERLAPDCVILLDDADREEEQAIASRWKDELGASLEVVGSIKPYIKMKVMETPHPEPASRGDADADADLAATK